MTIPKKEQRHQWTKTYRFEQEYKQLTKPRQGAPHIRVFARHVNLHISITNHQEIRLHMIKTPIGSRRRGFASDALKWLCEMADGHGIRITLCPAPEKDCNMSLVGLTLWYNKHGFEDFDNDEMIRYPKT